MTEPNSATHQPPAGSGGGEPAGPSSPQRRAAAGAGMGGAARPARRPPAAIDPAVIPAALRERRQWLVWREERRNGKPTKVPIDPKTGEHASTTDPTTWCSFDEALAHSEAYAGLGFVFTPDDPFFGLDLDGCRDAATGAIAAWATDLLNEFATYAEVSPSGTGVKLFGQGCLPEGTWHKRNLPAFLGKGEKPPAIERYDRARFFTVTGQHLAGTPRTVADCEGALQALQARFARPEAPAGNGRTPPGLASLTLEDETLLKKARGARNGEKFARLFDAGDCSAYGGDDSAADFALVTCLAFYSDDPAQIERLARRSALVRPKWDEPRPGGTYLSTTIGNALKVRTGRYEPRSTPGRPRGGRSATPPPPAAPRRPPEAPVPVPPVHRTDLGNAMRLVARHGANLRFSMTHGWLVWDGRRWGRDETGAVIRSAKETVRWMYQAAGELGDPEARKALAHWAIQSESARRIQAMVKLGESEPGIPVRAAELDTNRWLLNCGNGTLDLATGTLRPHRREDLCTKLTPVEYHPDAPCPLFRQFLGEIMAGREELVQYLQRAVGYSLTGDVSEQCLFFLHGLGANGKSTLLDLLLALLGDYAMPAPPGLLLERGGEHHPTERADLAGKRLVVSVEVGEGKRLAEELLKQLTGGDRLKARFMRQDFFEFAPEFKLWLAANHKPVVKGTDHAIWRRIPLIPFDVTFGDEPGEGTRPKDPRLLETLLGELPGILAWAVEGCLLWQRERLSPPAVVQQATAAYRAEMDTLGEFLTDCCALEPRAQAKAGDLYGAYKNWCESAGERPISQKAFGTRLQERGFTPRRDGYARWWTGLGLLAPPGAAEGG